MELWDPVEFGARALSLRSAATKPRQQVQKIQHARLKKLLQHARANSPFYRRKLAGIDERGFRLSDLPTSTKSELMDNFEEVLTVDDVQRDDVERFLGNDANLGKYFRDTYVLSHTSGTQGRPLLLVQSKDNLQLLFALHAARGNRHRLSVWEAVKHFIEPVRLAAVLLKRGFYPSGCAFEYMPAGAKRYLDVLRLTLTDLDMIERLAEFRPTHLTAYASVLHEIARHIEKGRLTLKPELQQVVNISERLLPQTRKHYAKVFGTPILDDYAMGECLFATNGCAQSGGMHINADWAILEVVDEHNRPVPDGTRGAKVLLTNLANYVQPFIRYEIGDILTMATKPCGCGNNLPLVARVEGRDLTAFWIDGEDGLRPLTSGVFETALSQITEIREYQIVQEDTSRFRVRIEPFPAADLDRERVSQILLKQLDEYRLADQLQVTVETVDRLAPEGGDKFKRVISKVPSPQERHEELVSGRR